MSESSLLFPHPVLTPFPPGVSPSYATIQKCQTELNANAQSIRSAAGGILGHLATTMTTAQYLEISTDVAFIVPVNPGDNPTHAPGATQHQITETNRAHLVTKKIYDLYCDVNLALTKQLLVACPELFLEALKKPHIGYGNVTILQFMTHLWKIYGKIEPAHLVENEKLMKAAWHTNEPIEKLFSQLKTTFEFAKAGNAGLTEINVVRTGYQIIVDNGMFKHDLKEWRKKPIEEWTLTNFTAFFTAANTDRMATTADGGFHSANAASSTVLSELAALKLEFAKFKKSVAPKPSNNNPTNNTIRPPQATSYCHTHGVITNLAHNSKTCEKKGANHQDEATMDNKMGGTTRVWSNTPRV